MHAWAKSRYTGLFTHWVRAPRRPHDPDVFISAGELPAWTQGEPAFGCSGAGWTPEAADLACLGEGIERLLARPLPDDGAVLAAWDNWPLAEPAIAPERWVLFGASQYARPGFPFAPLERRTKCRWACCRHAETGEAAWAPEELVYLAPRPGQPQQFTLGYSTGLSCGHVDQAVLLRGAQEVIERDAIVGGWWRVYPVTEWAAAHVRELLGPEICQRVERPNLTYRFYHIQSPYSAHVTLVSLAGQDAEGWVFSVGTACRETLALSWEKSVLEAIQGRHCVRRLLSEWHESGCPALETPQTFFEHALYYAVHPERLSETVLEQAPAAVGAAQQPARAVEGLRELTTRLGPDRPVMFRNLTPPALASEWLALRVLIPGLQPLHGHHELPFQGGPLWRAAERHSLAVPPHPFA